MRSLDTPWNGIFGLVVTFWATLFVESWKRKQTTIQFLWGCSDSSFSSVDERFEFRYYNVYNKRTDAIEKTKQTMKKKKECTYTFLSYLFLIIVFSSMAIYQTLIFTTKPKIDAEGKPIPGTQTMQMKILGTIYTTVYSVIVVLFGSLYKILAVRQTEDENHRYWKQYTDALSSRLF